MHASLYAIPVVLVAFAIIGFVFLVRPYAAPRGREAGAQDDGPFVAEVWLEWEICRGSTLYRQRFRDQRCAERAVRKAAAKLDMALPSYYMDTDWSGRRVPYKYEYEIRFGVRPAVATDTTTRIWSPVMPGTTNDSGEHRESHPLMRLPRAAELNGCKL